MKADLFSVFPRILLFSCIVISHCLPICDCTITIRPTHAVVIATTSVKLKCISEFDEMITWFKRGTENNELEIKQGFSNRYDVKDNFKESTLLINSSMTKDSGEFYCKTVIENSTTVTLMIITPTPTWFPSCRQHPERLTSGTDVEITCFSSINAVDTGILTLPYLTWNLDGFIINNTPFINATYASVKYTRTVNRDDHGRQFTCQATLDNLQNPPPSCSVTLFIDWSNSNIVPYIIVAVLSIIAIILFAIVIIFVFRFRECKLCKETVPQPQQVLDMSALQDGVGVPMTVLSDQSSDDETVNLPKKKTKSKEQPKAQPKAKTKARIISNSNSNLKETSRQKQSEDAILNFDDNFQKPENKEYETKTKDIDLNMKMKEKSASHGDVKQYRSNRNQSANKAGHSNRTHAQIGAKIRPKSLPNTRFKEPMHNINNLGGSSRSSGGSKRSSSKGNTDDKVVYADLSFARNPGLNITKPEHL